MFLVTGGQHYDSYDTYDSTEILDLMVGRWVASGAKLPQTRAGLTALNFNNRVLIFGNDNPTSLFESKYKSICAQRIPSTYGRVLFKKSFEIF